MEVIVVVVTADPSSAVLFPAAGTPESVGKRAACDSANLVDAESAVSCEPPAPA